MVFTNFCAREGRVLKACTREGRVFSDKCILERVWFFQGICVKGGTFANSDAMHQFVILYDILNYRNCVNLHKWLQWTMFPSSCTTKGMLF